MEIEGDKQARNISADIGNGTEEHEVCKKAKKPNLPS
jgi:hypothetical protein